MISVEKWEVYVCAIQSKLEKEICNWRAKYENLDEEKEKLAEEIPEKRKEQDNEYQLDNEYQQLTKYIDRLQNENLGIHRGAGIPNLKTKQAQTEN